MPPFGWIGPFLPASHLLEAAIVVGPASERSGHHDSLPDTLTSQPGPEPRSVFESHHCTSHAARSGQMRAAAAQ